MSHRAGTVAAASMLGLLVLAPAAAAAGRDSPSTSLTATTSNGHGQVTAACTGTATGGSVDFGDGTTAVLRPPGLSATHAYGPGTFTAKLTCSDSSGSSVATATVSSTGGATIAGGSEHASSTLTPGALNSAVTQATIASTICAPGWAASVAPSAAYLAALKGKQLRRYHAPGKPASYAEDHLIPIELGGAASDPKNLWPQPRARVRADSLVADALAREVCAGTLPLARAQKVIAALKHAAG